MRLKRERADSRAAPRGETLTRSPFFRWMTMFEMSITCSESPRKILLADIEMENSCMFFFLSLSLLVWKEIYDDSLEWFDGISMLPTCFQLRKILLIDDDYSRILKYEVWSFEVWSFNFERKFMTMGRKCFFLTVFSNVFSLSQNKFSSRFRKYRNGCWKFSFMKI